MESFDTLGGFLEHISLVMDGDTDGEQGEVMLMTLHSAKGLEFDTIFLPGWEEGVFPSQRTIDENGAALRPYNLPFEQVFEDRRVRVVDLDDDGLSEVILIVADRNRGAAVALYAFDPA